MAKFSAILISAIFVLAVCSWVYFLIGSYKVLVNKDKSYAGFTSVLLIISGMITSLFFLFLRYFYGN